MSFASSNNSIISRKVLFDNLDKSLVALSPDGQHISYLAPKEGVLNIWVGPSNDLSKSTPVTNDTNRGIQHYSWAFNGEHIIYSQDSNGDENFRLYSLSLKSGNITLITPPEAVRASIRKISQQVPDVLLVEMNDRNKNYFDIHKVNLTDNTSELVLKNDRFSAFIIDEGLHVRFAIFHNNDGSEEYYELKDNEWSSFMNVSLEDAFNTYITGFVNTGQMIYLLDSRERNTSVLKSLDLKTKKYTVIAEDVKADIEVFTWHPITKTIQAVKVNYDKVTYNVLDNSIKSDIEYLKLANPGKITINTRTLDDQKWLVAYFNDNTPIRYYLYDRNITQTDFIFSSQDNLAKYPLSNMQPIIIKSRDSLDLVSYITFPIDTILNDKLAPTTQLPLILLVHGGPWARDNWELNLEHKWLANRGYAVLSVNFRGSTGFGKDFINAGNKEWGHKMQDDLIDAVSWAINNHIADPKKIAIMGASYGGYAALVGLTLTPDLFACGVDLAGPSSVVTLMNSIPPYWQADTSIFKKRIGPWDTEQDIEKLKQISPLTFADKIKKPLFVAQGTHDPRVKKEESEQIVKVMRDKNIPVIYALYEDEGHGFVKPGNKLSYYALLEQFLMKVLGGKAEPIGDDLNDANFLLNDKLVNNVEYQDILTELFAAQLNHKNPNISSDEILTVNLTASTFNNYIIEDPNNYQASASITFNDTESNNTLANSTIPEIQQNIILASSGVITIGGCLIVGLGILGIIAYNHYSDYTAVNTDY